MLCFCFQIKDSIIREDVWNQYFNKANNYKILIHAYSPRTLNINVDFEYEVIPTVKTTWEQTLNSHLQFFNHFLQTKCTKLILLSESCIPIKKYDELYQFLNGNFNSYFTSLKDIWWNKGNVKRFIHPNVRKFALAHEQWVILDRTHVQVLHDNAKLIQNYFKTSSADNEYYTATMLNYFKQENIENYPIWYTEWAEKSRHPRTFTDLNEVPINPDSFFIRKVNENTILRNI